LENAYEGTPPRKEAKASRRVEGEGLVYEPDLRPGRKGRAGIKWSKRSPNGIDIYLLGLKNQGEETGTMMPGKQNEERLDGQGTTSLLLTPKEEGLG